MEDWVTCSAWLSLPVILRFLPSSPPTSAVLTGLLTLGSLSPSACSWGSVGCRLWLGDTRPGGKAALWLLHQQSFWGKRRDVPKA